MSLYIATTLYMGVGVVCLTVPVCLPQTQRWANTGARTEGGGGGGGSWYGAVKPGDLLLLVNLYLYLV